MWLSCPGWHRPAGRWPYPADGRQFSFYPFRIFEFHHHEHRRTSEFSQAVRESAKSLSVTTRLWKARSLPCLRAVTCCWKGVPGLGKTLLVRTLGEVLDLSFNRIQFTPDLMPADILGTNIVMEDARRPAASSSSSRGRFSRTWSWRTKSTAPRPKPNPHCWRPCRNTRSPPAARCASW